MNVEFASPTQINTVILIFSLFLNRRLEAWIAQIVNVIATRKIKQGHAVHLGENAPVYLSPQKSVALFVYSIGVIVAFLIGNSTAAKERETTINSTIIVSSSLLTLSTSANSLFRDSEVEGNKLLGYQKTIRNPRMESIADENNWLHWKWQDYDASVEVIEKRAGTYVVLFNGRYKCRGEHTTILNMYPLREASNSAFDSWVRLTSNEVFRNEIDIFGKKARLVRGYRKVNITRDSTVATGFEIEINDKDGAKKVIEQVGETVLVYDVKKEGKLSKHDAVRIKRYKEKLDAKNVLIAAASGSSQDREVLLENISSQVFPVSVEESNFAVSKTDRPEISMNLIREDGRIFNGTEIRGGLKPYYLMAVCGFTLALRLLLAFLRYNSAGFREIKIDDTGYIASLAINSTQFSSFNGSQDIAVIGNTIEVDPDNKTELVNHLSILHVKDKSRTRPFQENLKLK